MKILHVSANATYNDNWGYQDNLLPKYHKKLGHEVAIIVPNKTYQNGKVVAMDCLDYVLQDGVRVVRMKYKKYFHRTITGVLSRLPIFAFLKEYKPDLIFCHGLVSSTILEVVKYKKKIDPKCIVVQDNHLDPFNHGTLSSRLLNGLFKRYYRRLNRKSIKYVEKVYGVTPLRKTFAEEYFQIPKEKTDVLIMGADDESLDLCHREQIKEEIRKKYNVQEDEFLIVAGGKIDEKKNIHLLMEACRRISGVRLLVFGNLQEEIKEQFQAILQKATNVDFVGWMPAEKVYDYFLSADMVVFPGLHSVMWEQACAAKVPCLFNQLEGIEHVNNGGNSDFIFPVTIEEIEKKIREYKFTNKYEEMKSIALSEKTDVYLYSEIAKKSLEITRKN